MIECYGSLWDYPANARAILTNGVVTINNSRLVMGGGVAKEARDRLPGLDLMLGEIVSVFGNHVYVVELHGVTICSFPTKDDWRLPSDLALIERSCGELMEEIDKRDWDQVVLPRPGTGLGRLDWEGEVKPVIETILDDRVHVITWRRDP